MHFNTFRTNLKKFYKIFTAVLCVFTIFGCSLSMKTQKEVDLRKLDRTGHPNDWMACSRNICLGDLNTEIPIFAISKQKLIQLTKRLFIEKPRTKFIRFVPKLDQLIFVQRSKFLRFPDTVWIQFFELETGTSLIIYSRSNYGYYDFGVNRKRVNSWIKSLEAVTQK